MSSRPPSPHLKGYFSSPFERFVRDEGDWAGAFTLLDTVETYFDSHVDLLQRKLQSKLQKHSGRIKKHAEERFSLSGDIFADNFEREFKSFKLKVSTRMTALAASWESAKVVRTREKATFLFGVMTLVFSTLLFGLAPQWVHIAYTVLGCYLLPLRIYSYKKKLWHYFLFDLCYYTTIFNFIYIWFLPSSTALFTACYCLSHGSLASAIITWRNSLVFHDQEKVTSLFIHIYAPFAFTVIRHFYPDAPSRFPALADLPTLEPGRALLISGGLYAIWQVLYWKFLLVDRADKIFSGQRTTSFSWLLADKRGVIGRMLHSVPPEHAVATFMVGQFVYAIVTQLPAIFILYNSSLWSGIFLIVIFAVSVWNGGGFYIEVFGRKFERELEALRRELAESASRSGNSTPATEGHSRSRSESDVSSASISPHLGNESLPSLITPTDLTFEPESILIDKKYS